MTSEALLSCCCNTSPGICPCAQTSVNVNWGGLIRYSPIDCLTLWSLFAEQSQAGVPITCYGSCYWRPTTPVEVSSLSSNIALSATNCSGCVGGYVTVHARRYVISFMPGFGTPEYYDAQFRCLFEEYDGVYFEGADIQIPWTISVAAPRPASASFPVARPKWLVGVQFGSWQFRFESAQDFQCDLSLVTWVCISSCGFGDYPFGGACYGPCGNFVSCSSILGCVWEDVSPPPPFVWPVCGERGGITSVQLSVDKGTLVVS